MLQENPSACESVPAISASLVDTAATAPVRRPSAASLTSAPASSLADADGDLQYYYSRDGAPPVGPTSFATLLEMASLRTLRSSDLVWSTHMPAWAPADSLPQLALSLRTVTDSVRDAPQPPVPAEAAAVEILWFYAAGQIERRGPVTAGEIARLFAVGDIDGLTLVWTPGMPEWAPVCEVPPLKAALQEVTAVDEVAAGTDSGVGDGEYGEQSAANANASRDAAPSARQATDSDVSAPTAAARRRYRPAAVQAAAAYCVYVSGMPPDVTVAEVAAHFRAAGLLAHEPDENAPGGERPRVRLYTNADSSLKGDGTVAYIRPESVSLAVTLLDEAPLRAGGAPLHVEPATWGHKDSGSGDGKQQAQRRPKKKNPPAGGAQSAASKLPRVKDLERQVGGWVPCRAAREISMRDVRLRSAAHVFDGCLSRHAGCAVVG